MSLISVFASDIYCCMQHNRIPDCNVCHFEYMVIAVIKVRKPFTGNGEKRTKSVSYIKPGRKQIIIFTNVIKWITNYYDTNI